jgi:hypothetical protein
LSTHSFFRDTVQLEFDEKSHTYYREADDHALVKVPGVTTVCNILDHSIYLMPWAVKVAAQKLLATVPVKDNRVSISWKEFEQLVTDSKKAHREHFDAARDVGQLAHNWIDTAIVEAINTDGVIHEMPMPMFDDERAYNCGMNAFNWIQEHNVRWLASERKVYSRKFEYAGTMDGLATVDSCVDAECCKTWFVDALSLIDWKSSNHLRAEYLYQTAAYQQAYEEETGQAIEARWILRLGKEEGEFQSWYTTDFALHINAFLSCLSLYRNHNEVQESLKEGKRGRRQTR